MKKLRYLFFIFSLVFAESGAYDNGTSTGKGKFQLDITWNPFNSFDFGQTYFVMSYGLNKSIDLHGYISNHNDEFSTHYVGIFYQFINEEKIHLATAVGIRSLPRGEFDVFAPQMLYTYQLNKKYFAGGSIVNIRGDNLNQNKGTTIDIGLFRKYDIKSNLIENISLGISAFHPTTWKPNSYFLPAYSIDIKFK